MQDMQATVQEFAAAVALHQAGTLDAAERGYLAILSTSPNHANTLGMLGTLYLETGRFQQANDLLTQAISLTPDNPTFLLNHLNISLLQGNLAKASESLGQLQCIAPNWYETHLASANLLAANNNWSDALAIYTRLYEIAPTNLHAQQGLAKALEKLGRNAEAIDALLNTRDMIGNDVELDLQLFNLLLKERRIAEAQALKNVMETYCPDDRRFLTESAKFYSLSKDDDNLIETINKVLAKWPEDLQAKLWLIDFLQRKGRFGEALLHLNDFPPQASHEMRDYAYANLLMAMHCYGAAESVLSKLDTPISQQLFGHLAIKQGKYSLACEYFQKWLDLHPDDISAKVALAMAQFLLGDEAAAWSNYSARLFDWTTSLGATPLPNVPAWTGQSLHEKRIFVFCEQGIGDTIQFIRYVPELVRRGAKPVLHIYPEIIPIFQVANTGSDTDNSSNSPQPTEFDFQIPLLSLPQLLDKTTEHQSDCIPYIEANPAAILQWDQVISEIGSGLRVGVVWAGNPQHLNDANRSLDVAALNQWARIPGVRWINLQYGDIGNQPEVLNLDWPLIRLPAPITSLQDTTAIISHLDLVITVDTSVAHLAGAMGKQVWMMLPFSPDWRWRGEGRSTPWYPTMVLYRQQVPGDWQYVIDTIEQDLMDHLTSHAEMLTPIQSWALAPTEHPTREMIRHLERYDVASLFPLLLQNEVTLNEFCEAGVDERLHSEYRDRITLSKGHLVAPAEHHRNCSPALINQMWRALRDATADEKRDWLFQLEAIRPLTIIDFWRAADCDPMEAEPLLRKFGELVPRHLPCRLAACSLMERLAQKKQVLHYAQTSVYCSPRSPEAWAKFMVALIRFGLARFAQDLLSDIESHIKTHEDYPYIMAHIAMQLERPQEAKQWLEQIVRESRPMSARAILHQYEAYARLGKFQLARDITFLGASHSTIAPWKLLRSFLDLQTHGDLQAWDEYEERPFPHTESSPVAHIEKWEGQPLAGKTLLVYAEQGFGDQIYFGKCVPQLLPQKLILALEGGLGSLLQVNSSCSIISPKALHEGKESTAGIDYAIRIGSLPKLLGYSVNTPPLGTQYLQASEEKRRNWKSYFAPFAGRRIGLSWAGNPDYARDEYRSFKLSRLADLATVDDVTYFSLQLGSNQREILQAPTGLRVLDLSAKLDDFTETAAIISELDLVITVDTAIAHLAGALGKPVWILIPHDCDWRWGLERSDCPWYPSMRIFRQPAQGCWTAVISDVVAALRNDASRDTP